jgi:hypothetical protein
MELNVHRSRRGLLIAIAVAVGLWIVYAAIGPGDDFFRCYTWMVVEPQRLPSVAQQPWTLNPLWQNWFMAPFVTMPGRSGYLLFLAFTLGAVVYVSYFFGGKPALVVLSANMAWVLWWGQLEGWAALGLLLAYVALQNRSWVMLWIALMLATFKPQVGFAPVAALWWWHGRERWKALLALFVVFVITLLAWGPWPIWFASGLLRFAGDGHSDYWNASLGWIALPLFVPALLLPLSREKRLIALTATTLLVSSYMPFYSTILLLCFAVPWWAYGFGFLGYLVPIVGHGAWNAVVFLPLTILLWLYKPLIRNFSIHLREYLSRRQRERRGTV